ncbi:hypothetical protein Hamer_G010649, partial [Homarus americanus]
LINFEGKSSAGTTGVTGENCRIERGWPYDCRHSKRAGNIETNSKEEMNCEKAVTRGRVLHRTPAIKAKLDRHRTARLQFAQRYEDEKTFASTTYGPLHCWRPNNTRYERQNISEAARSGHVTDNVWGWINAYGMGILAETEGRFNSEKYLDILEEDNFHIHTARIISRWFDEQPDIKLMEWPSKWCDLSPHRERPGNHR